DRGGVSTCGGSERNPGPGFLIERTVTENNGFIIDYKLLHNPPSNYDKMRQETTTTSPETAISTFSLLSYRRKDSLSGRVTFPGNMRISSNSLACRTTNSRKHCAAASPTSAGSRTSRGAFPAP